MSALPTRAARAAFSEKALYGKDQEEIRAMLTSAGFDFDGYPKSFRMGIFLQRLPDFVMVANRIAINFDGQDATTKVERN
jgi:hypothetical protein